MKLYIYIYIKKTRQFCLLPFRPTSGQCLQSTYLHANGVSIQTGQLTLGLVILGTGGHGYKQLILTDRSCTVVDLHLLKVANENV